HRAEGGRALGARLGQAVELLDLGEADVHLRPALGAAGLDHGRQAVQGLRPEHQVDEGRALEDGLALLAGDAAADADQHRPVLLQVLPAAELGEHLLLGLFADRAGIDQDDVGLGLVPGQFQAVLGQQYVGHAGRVVLVHLATVGLDVELALAGRGSGHGGGYSVPGGGIVAPGPGRGRPGPPFERRKPWQVAVPGVNLAPMSLRLPLLACLLLAAAPAGAGTLYRCTGADGIPNYTGKKVPGAHCEVVANYTAADSRPRGPAPRPAAPVATG